MSAGRREKDAATGFGENAARGRIKRSQTVEKEATALFFLLLSRGSQRAGRVYEYIECAPCVCVLLVQ
jgi:hypothetical protein